MIDKNGIERCDFAHAHEDIVRTVMDRMPDEETLYDLAELFKVFGDSTRVKILCVLFEAEMCVCDIAELLSMSQSAISHQLRLMRARNSVKFRKEGKMAYYSLADEHVLKLIEMGVEHAREKR